MLIGCAADGADHIERGIIDYSLPLGDGSFLE
jgi:hypothetical protein